MIGMSEPKQVIVVRKDLNMRKGKMCAQVAHAAMKFLLTHGRVYDDRENYGGYGATGWVLKSNLTGLDAAVAWIQGRFTKVVVGVSSEQELRDLVRRGREAGLIVEEVVDAGLTEFHGVPTLTCVAFGPDLPEKVDAVTGKLPLL